MIKLSEKDISQFQSLLGFGIDVVSSRKLAVYHDHAISQDLLIMVSSQRLDGFGNLILKADFFENENEDVFYDYSVERKGSETNTLNAELHLKTSYIKKVQIFGRKFNAQEFKMYSSNYHLDPEADRTDDLFVFDCKNGEQVMIVFHPFFPQIEILFNPNAISTFWSNYNDSYVSKYILS